MHYYEYAYQFISIFLPAVAIIALAVMQQKSAYRQMRASHRNATRIVELLISQVEDLREENSALMANVSGISRAVGGPPVQRQNPVFLIKQGRLSKALDLMSMHGGLDKDVRNQAIAIMGRLAWVERSYGEGKMDAEKFDVFINQIRAAAISIAEGIRKEDAD